jgi:hypothetical protein
MPVSRIGCMVLIIGLQWGRSVISMIRASGQDAIGLVSPPSRLHALGRFSALR